MSVLPVVAKAEAADQMRPKGSMSLTRKGAIVFVLMISYALALAAYGWHQKEDLLDQFVDLQNLHQQEGVLRQTNIATFHEMASLFILIDITRESDPERIMAHMGDLSKRYVDLVQKYPGLAPRIDGLSASMKRAMLEPNARNLLAMRSDLEVLKDELLRLADRAQRKQKVLADQYRQQGNHAAIILIMLGLLGVVVIGAIAATFFTHMTGDLLQVRARAIEIIQGFRGNPIPVRRNDELGELVRSVNRMAEELGNRERELEIERQKYYQHDKMAAIGTLAAGIVHEIGNPIAAINGLVANIRDHYDSLDEEQIQNSLQMILEHTDRLASINRDVSEFSMSRTEKRELLDLNVLINTTFRLMRHDARFRTFDFQVQLDSSLPAVLGVGDQLIQVIMNLMINAADAILESGKTDQILVVSTQFRGNQIALSVEDNGTGIKNETLDHVFEAFFTTKEPGKGTGLGLSLCYNIVNAHEGNIEIESEPDKGTLVRVLLPMGDV